MMKKLLILFFAVLLAGCAAVVKVEGDQVVKDRLTLKLPAAWNRMAMVHEPYELWTQDGITIDQLRIWAGVKPGEALIKAPPAHLGLKDPRLPTFTAGMAPDQLARQFEIMYTVYGWQAKVTRIEPGEFAGEKGVRFELAMTKKGSELLMKGVGWAAVRNGELYAATFTAPELSFFKRQLPKAEAVVASARIKS